MNRGVMQSSAVQQITAAGNPNWWNISSMTMLPPSHHFPAAAPLAAAPLPTTTSFVPQSPLPFSPLPCWPLDSSDYNCHNAALQSQSPAPDSWTHLFMGGLASEEEKAAAIAGLMNQFPENHQQDLEHLLVKQHNSSSGFVFGNSNQLIANSTSPTPTTTTSPQSNSISTFSSTNLLELSPTTTTVMSDPPPPPPPMADPTRECNGGSVKKAKVQGTATQASFKVRKFGDRITSLHQLVSPFGKTDTASVLLEAIGYIRFLQSQVEALSHPYLNSGSGNNKRQQLQQPPQSLLNGICLKRKGGPDQDVEEPRKDLRSRGLCLVPASMTSDVGRDNGADYWAPVLGGFR